MATEPGKEGAAPTLEELTGKVDDLTKGIASYRDKAQEAETKAAAAEAKATSAEKAAEDLRKEIEVNKNKKDDKAVELNPKDQERLDAWAKSQGFVTKAEMDVQKVSLFNESVKGAEGQAVAEFLESHPEYSDKEKWAEVTKQFGQYKQPTSLTGYRNLLNKIFKELNADDERAAEIRAKDEQKKRLGLGGKGGNNDKSDSAVTLEQLRDRYPNLSEEQIVSTLAEINQAAADRAKRNAARKK